MRNKYSVGTAKNGMKTRIGMGGITMAVNLPFEPDDITGHCQECGVPINYQDDYCPECMEVLEPCDYCGNYVHGLSLHITEELDHICEDCEGKKWTA